MSDPVTVTIEAEADVAGIVDGREVARELIRHALAALSPYVDGCPVCTYALLSGIGAEVIKAQHEAGEIDGEIHQDGRATAETVEAHVARARPSTAAMLDGYGQTHHRTHADEAAPPPAETPRRGMLTDDEATTVLRLAAITGRTSPEVLRQIERSPEAWQWFRVAVSLASETWDHLDGETGQWSTNDEKQERQFRSYAATLFDDAAPAPDAMPGTASRH